LTGDTPYFCWYAFVLPTAFADRLKTWEVLNYLPVIHPNPAAIISERELRKKILTVPRSPSEFAHVIRTFASSLEMSNVVSWKGYCPSADFNTDFSDAATVLAGR
jgi:hypothetical protein